MSSQSQPTVLTFNNLRLHLPANTAIPSLRTSATSSAIEITFQNFSGTVLFEPLSQLTPQTPLAPVPPVSCSPHPPPHQLLSLDHAASHHHVLPCSTPVASQQLPMSHPIPAPQLHISQPLASHPLPNQHSVPSEPLQQEENLHHSYPSLENPVTQPMSQPLSQAPSQPLSQPLTQPAMSQQMSQALAQPMTQRVQQPLSQMLFEQSLAHSMQRAPPPMADHFHENTYMPLTPPSSDADMEDYQLLAERDREIELQIAENERKGAEKRLPSPDYKLAVKTGKRVRFQKLPEILNQDEGCGKNPKVVEDEEDKVEKRVEMPVKRPKKASPWKPIEVEARNGMPLRRWGASFTSLNDGTVILLGGENEKDGFFDGMAVLDVGSHTWIQGGKDTPGMPKGGRAWHTTTRIDANLFIFGGEKEVDGKRIQTNDALIYDSSYFAWYPPLFGGPRPSARAGHCAELVPGTKNIVFYGGINGNRWLNDMYVLVDLCNWRKIRVSNKSVRPCARSYASLTAANGFVALFGGNNKTRCFNDVYLLDPKDLTWSEPIILGRAPKPRTGHCSVASKDGKSIFVYGGWDDQGAQRLFFSDVWELIIKSKTDCQWRCVFSGDNSCKTPGPRAGAVLERVGKDKNMYLFGGWHQVSHFNDLTELCVPFTKKIVGIHKK